MEIAFSSKIKQGFINGTCVQPDLTSSLYEHWSRCNHFVTSWILNTVSAEFMQSLEHWRGEECWITAKDLWDVIKIVINKNKISKICNLRKEIASLTQGNLSLTAYYTKFRALTDELDVQIRSFKCTCGECTITVNAHLENFTRKTRLSQFLMGLRDENTGLPFDLLMLQPIPTLHEAYSSIIRRK